MNIGIYRSRDSKILNNSAFSEKIFQKVKNIHSVDMIIDEDVNTCKQKIMRSDLVILFSHGSYQGMFHRFLDNDGCELKNIEWLIGTEKNPEIFSGKKVIAFSCMTAMRDINGIGEKVIKDHSCKVYFGFENYINRNLPEDYLAKIPSDIDTKNFISSIYASVFSQTLNEAVERNFSFKKFAQLTKLLLLKSIKKKLQDEFSNHVDFSMHLKGAIPVIETAESIIVLGDDSIRFCS